MSTAIHFLVKVHNVQFFLLLGAIYLAPNVSPKVRVVIAILFFTAAILIQTLS